MFCADYHVHSILSFDGRAPLTEMARAARAAGAAELCVTDHYDLLDAEGRWERPLDWAPALAQAERARRDCPDMVLKLGIELGAATADPARARQVLLCPELDFVIGSIHNYSLPMGGKDLYYSDFSDRAICYAAMDDFMDNMQALAELPDCYDVLGHIIYLLRYMPDPIPLDRYWPRIEVLLRTAIGHGRGIEVNLYRGQTVVDWAPLLRRYRTLGGEIVTLGTDAHHPGHFAGYAAGLDLLRACGFRYLCTYEKRAPAFHKL